MSEHPDDREWDEFQAASFAKGCVCKLCNATITLADKEAYFDSGYCSRCKHKMDND